MNKLLVIGNMVAAVRNGKTEFIGKITALNKYAGREHKGYNVRLEDGKTYQLYWECDYQFVDPEDAPKAHVKTAKERGEEPCEYFSSYRW